MDEKLTIDKMEAGKNFERFECEVVIVNPPNEYDKDGLKTRIQNLVVKDSEGKTVTLVLWNSQLKGDWVVGDKLLIGDGFCKTYDGNKQISTGKLGLITRVAATKKKGKKLIKGE
jgi:ssDNA-binding replication factor A large subunit